MQREGFGVNREVKYNRSAFIVLTESRASMLTWRGVKTASIYHHTVPISPKHHHKSHVHGVSPVYT